MRARIPGPVRTAARALGLPLAEVTRYWYDERSALQRGLAALGVGLLATLVAGVVLGSATERLEALPGLLLLIPAAIGMRGSNFGALAARLGTGIHTGEFEIELARRNFFGRQIEAAAILTFTSSAGIAVLAWFVGRAFGVRAALGQLVVISVVGGLLSSVVLVGVTIVLARQAYLRGWNMDDVGAPAITATGDLVTLPALLLASLLVEVPGMTATLGVAGVLAGGWALWRGWRHPQPDVRRIVRESVVVLTLAATVDIFAGTVVESRAEQFFDVPALLILVPPFIAASGSLGGILASRLASKLHLGLMEPRALPGKIAALDVSVTLVFAVTAFAGVGAVTRLAAELIGRASPPLPQLLAITSFGGLLAFALLSAVAYAAATATYRFGLDPDNHSIPIVTATMDLLGVLCLVAGIALVRME
ncbi:MAG TPA: magnesium transporter [Nitriliruptorales bacterium]|nr:magnesium transporter [Nitriliruptorales bacterium]